MAAYGELFDAIQFLLHIAIASKFSDLSYQDIFNAKVALSQKKMTHILYLSSDVQKSLEPLFDIENKSTEQIFEILSDIALKASNDLHIKRHDFITNLTVVELNALKQRPRAKE